MNIETATIKIITDAAKDMKDRIAALEARNAELVGALAQLYNAIPFDVLRMKAGNGFLDMERVDKARDVVSAILARTATK